MLKKSSSIFLLALALMVMLVSCQRSASQAPLVTPTGTSAAVSTDIGQVQMIGTTQMIQTLTALYQAASLITPDGSQPTSTVNGAGTQGTPVVPPTGAASTPAPGITPVVIVATATPGRPASYTLMQGEFPYCIARRFNVNQDELLALNGLTSASASSMQAGAVLHIPQSGSPFVGDRARNPHPATYTVSSSNETIYSVACHFGNIDPTQIIAANALVSPYTLHINQTLNIP